jgi:endonuclease-3
MATSKTEKRKAQKILNRLREELPSSKMKGILDPFKTLIMTVISQNTNDRNMERAYHNLSKRFKIDPEVLSNVDLNSIEDCLKVAGLYRGKARVIKTISTIILEDYNGSLDFIFHEPIEKAREMLIKLPVDRVAKRLALVNHKGDYKSVRNGLQALFKPEDYYDVHVYFISLGRRYCKARKPLCGECLLDSICPSTYLKSNMETKEAL